MILKGEPDFRRLGDSNDLLRLICGIGLEGFNVSFSFPCTAFIFSELLPTPDKLGLFSRPDALMMKTDEN